MKQFVSFVFVIFLFSSCATKTKIEYVDREIVKYEYKTNVDTILENTHDSIFQIIYQKGDTVYNTKYLEKTKYKYKYLCYTDTIYKDSIQTLYKQVVTEKKIIPKWCYSSLAVWLLLLIFATYKVYKWLH